MADGATLEPASPPVLLANWTIVPLLLKPDALSGDLVEVPGALAADFASSLAFGLDFSPPDFTPHVGTTLTGARRAEAHARAEMAVVPWYLPPRRAISAARTRLLDRAAAWAAAERIAVGDVVSGACAALGFEIVWSADRVVSARDYRALYRDNVRREVDVVRRKYMLDRPVRLLLACGEQDNTALQLMKTYLRYVMRHPVEKKTVENWIHVTNPDATNYPDLLRMYGIVGAPRR